MGAAFAALALWASRRLPPHWINPAVSLAAVAALALLGEGVVRLRAVIAPSTQGFSSYTSQLWGRRFARPNRLGFRDREHDLVRPAATPTVASMTMVAVSRPASMSSVGTSMITSGKSKPLG